MAREVTDPFDASGGREFIGFLHFIGIDPKRLGIISHQSRRHWMHLRSNAGLPQSVGGA